MKLLSVTIPCYNSQDYMEHCIETLLTGGDDVEILIVDDGSKDATAEIADRYQKKYPTIIKAIHQENGGHGAAVNTGIANATGLYFKVVDSDDWVDEESYHKILAKLRELVGGSTTLDMLISNFVYEKQGADHKKVMKYTRMFPENEVFTWSDVRHISKGHYILMHSVIYRTQLLKDCGLELPRHTFYVDNLFVYNPLPYVKTMYYMKIANPKLRKYMFNYLEIITVVSTVLCLRSETEENLMKKRELWSYIKGYDLRLFHHLRRGILGQSMNLPGKGGRKISVAAYKLTQKIVGFN